MTQPKPYETPQTMTDIESFITYAKDQLRTELHPVPGKDSWEILIFRENALVAALTLAEAKDLLDLLRCSITSQLLRGTNTAA